MQDIMPPVGANAQLIQSYGSESFRIGNAIYSHSVLVLPTLTVAWNGSLELSAMEALLTESPPIEVLLIGTGKRHEMVSPELRKELKARGIALDTMDTGAACRTFNILLGESRRVAAALILPV